MYADNYNSCKMMKRNVYYYSLWSRFTKDIT